MATRRVSFIRPLLIAVAAFVLALALERFRLPSISFSLSAEDTLYRVVYSELRGSESTLWLADPAAPTERRRALFTINHQFGYGVVASLSPDGARLAYGFLPDGRRDAFSDGQLWVTSIDGQDARLIAGKIDLHFPPIWSPDGRRLLFKTVETVSEENPAVPPALDQRKPDQRPYAFSLKSSLAVALIDGIARPKPVVFALGPNLYPIDWSPDGKSAYYYTVEAGGSQVHLADVETAETTSLGLLFGGPVWNVKLSPDGRRLLYLSVQLDESATQGTAWVFDQDTQRSSRVSTPQLGPLGAIWDPSGQGITRNASPEPWQPGQLLLNTNIASGATQTFREDSGGTVAVPVSWSPDSDFLAIRRRSTSAGDALDNLAILDTRSGRLKEIRGGYAEFVGWTTLAK